VLFVSAVEDLSIILVSHNGDRWLRPCLTSVFAHLGDCDAEAVVVNNADDRTADILQADFPHVRLIRCENHGFAHANNRALLTSRARYALFLNVDTEILEGTFGELVRALDDRPTVGLAGVLQVSPGGAVAPTMRRFPNALRSLAEGLGSEHFPFRARWLGERELDLARHRQESACDWLSGSFLVARREALQSAGFMDERFFLYSEEPDLGLRVKQAGWEVRHLPVMTVLHHGGEYRTDPRLLAQDAYSRIQFADKHFSPPHRAAYRSALALGNALRAAAPGSARREQRRAARAALRVLVGLDGPPFGSPPGQALTPSGSDGSG
jgi:N-acetylglucosaminyl-diphospho-decaprenol L-rhamnosyltransferase